jgi:hypothetical protein
MPACPHIFALNANYLRRDDGRGVCEMAGVIEGSTSAPDFRDQAQQCLQLARAEPEGELRTILAGMALGWLKLADYTSASEAENQHPEMIAQR